MLNALSRNWWALTLRGVLAILFGIVVLLDPGIALAVLVSLFGAYAVVDGIFTIIAGFNGRQSNKNWWVLVLEGLVSIIAGVLTFLWPAITALILLYIIAVWAIVTGVLEIITAIRLREEIEGELWMGLSGLASIIIGVVLILFPGTGILTLLWLLAIYAIAFGVFLIVLSLQLRSRRSSAG